MKITVERLPESQVQLEIEVDPERLEQSMARVSRQVAQQVRIPGFRPGKAPRHIIERRIGRDELVREALLQLAPDLLDEAVAAESIDMFARPQVEVSETDPPTLKALVPVRPTVDLGDYHAIRLERDSAEVSDEMVDEQVDALRRRHATYAPVERPAQWNDILIADVHATVDDMPLIDQDGAEFQLLEDRTLVIDGLAEAIVGMSAEESKSIELPIGDEFQVEDLRGKDASVTITLHEVKEEILPDLDDDFASLVNPDEFETLEQLRDRLRADLETEARNKADADLQEKALDALLEQATIEYPRVLIDHEVEHMANEAVGNDQKAFQNHLQRIGRSPEEFRETFREAAEVRVRRALVLEQLESDENIDVPTSEIESELDELVAQLGENGAGFREQLLAGDGLQTLRRNSIRRKVLERLTAIVTGEADQAPAAADDQDTDEEEAPADDE